MKTLTDSHMLDAAKRRLAAHIATRPATIAEAAKIAAAYRTAAASLREQAASLFAIRPRTAAERVDLVGRGADCIALQHSDGRMVNAAVKESMELERQANGQDMHAEAWERISREAEGATWTATREELEGAVAYYERLIAARRS